MNESAATDAVPARILEILPEGRASLLEIEVGETAGMDAYHLNHCIKDMTQGRMISMGALQHWNSG